MGSLTDGLVIDGGSRWVAEKTAVAFGVQSGVKLRIPIYSCGVSSLDRKGASFSKYLDCLDAKPVTNRWKYHIPEVGRWLLGWLQNTPTNLLPSRGRMDSSLMNSQKEVLTVWRLHFRVSLWLPLLWTWLRRVMFSAQSCRTFDWSLFSSYWLHMVSSPRGRSRVRLWLRQLMLMLMLLRDISIYSVLSLMQLKRWLIFQNRFWQSGGRSLILKLAHRSTVWSANLQCTSRAYSCCWWLRLKMTSLPSRLMVTFFICCFLGWGGLIGDGL